MRTNRMWAVLLVVVALCARAPAGDGAAPGPKKKEPEFIVRSEEEWFAKVRDIDKIDSISIKKSDVVAKEAARTVIRSRVKIRDIRAAEEGVAIDIMDVVPLRAGAERLSRPPIHLPATDRAAIAAWTKWDRLVFKVKPKVTPDGALEYARLVTTAADIERTPNPGVEYPEPARPLARVDTFRDFVDRYTHAITAGKWRPVWQMYAQATAALFPMTAVVKDPGAGDAADAGSRPKASVHAFEIAESTGVTGYGLLDSKQHPISSVWIDVDDPQVAETLKNGMRADLYFWVSGIENAADLEVREGHFKVTVTFGRLK